jgi:hypothetical protein
MSDSSATHVADEWDDVQVELASAAREACNWAFGWTSDRLLGSADETSSLDSLSARDAIDGIARS